MPVPPDVVVKALDFCNNVGGRLIVDGNSVTCVVTTNAVGTLDTYLGRFIDFVSSVKAANVAVSLRLEKPVDVLTEYSEITYLPASKEYMISLRIVGSVPAEVAPPVTKHINLGRYKGVLTKTTTLTRSGRRVVVEASAALPSTADVTEIASAYINMLKEAMMEAGEIREETVLLFLF